MMRDELSSRRRGIFPDTVPPEHGAEQVLVTVSLDADLYEWLQGFVGRSTFTSNVEETVSTALRCIRGDLDWRMLQ